MPPELPLTEPARTRRSLRSATAATAVAAIDAPVLQTSDGGSLEREAVVEPTVTVAPLSRRAARQSLTAREEVVTPPVILDAAVTATESADLPLVAPRVTPLVVPVAFAAATEPAQVSVPQPDVFEMASRLFENTSPIADPAPAARKRASTDDGGKDVEADALPARFVGRSFRKIATVGVTAGAMGIAGLLAVAMTLPPEAVAAAQGSSLVSVNSLASGRDGQSSTKVTKDEIQAFVAPTDVQNESLAGAGGFSTISRADLAAEQGIRFSEELYTNDPTASIQWPYVVGVAMSSPFGQRWGRLHAGIDLVPGEGAPIQAIADGVVRLATESDGGYGVGVYIDHVIDGSPITSHYAHMQYGSLRVATGDVIKVGDIIGSTGNTGNSYGAHLHFELLVNEVPIDPLPWMMEHAGRK